VTFPRGVGQVPIYYAHKRTGRPATQEIYSSKYLDVDWTPQFPFGHGLSYARFEYAPPQLSATRIGPRDALKVRVTVKNTGKRAGDEIVQLYLRDDVASTTRPVRALRGFQRVTLAPGQAKTLVFTLDEEDYALLDARFRRVVEPGTFTVFAGGSSATTLEARFEVTAGAELPGPGSATPRSMRERPAGSAAPKLGVAR
jgi:beta-glucosidase